MFEVELNTTEIINDSIKSDFTLGKLQKTSSVCKEVDLAMKAVRGEYANITPVIVEFEDLISTASKMFFTDKEDKIEDLSRVVNTCLDNTEVILRDSYNINIQKECADLKESLISKYQTAIKTEDINNVRKEINIHANWTISKLQDVKDRIMALDGSTNVTALITPNNEGFSVNIVAIKFHNSQNREIAVVESEYDELYDKVKLAIGQFVKADIGDYLEKQSRYKAVVDKIKSGNNEQLLALSLCDFNTFYTDAVENLSLFDVSSRFARLFSKLTNKGEASEDQVEKLRSIKDKITKKFNKILDMLQDKVSCIDKLNLINIEDFLKLSAEEIIEDVTGVRAGFNISRQNSSFDIKTLARIDKELALKLARSGEIALILSGLKMDGAENPQSSDLLGGYIQEKHYMKKELKKENQQFNSKIIGIASGICKSSQLKQNIYEDFVNLQMVERVATAKVFNHHSEVLGRDIEVIADYEVHGYFGMSA